MCGSPSYFLPSDWFSRAEGVGWNEQLADQ
jgi:hypothetical protein